MKERPQKAGRIQRENPKPGWMRDNSPYRWFGQRHKVSARKTLSKYGTVNAKYELDRLKGAQGCAVCGIRYPEVLHFHHREPGTKLFNLSNPPATITWEEIRTETRKCDVLCGNCHALVHSGRIYRITSEQEPPPAGLTGLIESNEEASETDASTSHRGREGLRAEDL